MSTAADQVPVACWATKTGCPCHGVCFPSFSGRAGASRFSTKPAAWSITGWLELRRIMAENRVEQVKVDLPSSRDVAAAVGSEARNSKLEARNKPE